MFLILLSVVFSSCQVNASSDQFSWYCKRTKDHSQPELPPEFSFIEKHDGFFIDKKNVDSTAPEKVIYLTFDAGYENGNIEKVLNVLSDNDVKGAFFILSNLIKSSPELVKRMSNDGHLVCNHTSKHKDMSKIGDKKTFEAELIQLENEYRNLTGNELAKFFRPPEGRFSEDTLKFAAEMGYKTVFWSFAYVDWDNSTQMSEKDARNKILSNTHNGEVMLLHPTSKTNADILDSIIKELKEEGYRFGTLDELVMNG